MSRLGLCLVPRTVPDIGRSAMSPWGRVGKIIFANGTAARRPLNHHQRASRCRTTGVWRIAPAEDMIASLSRLPGRGHKRSREIQLASAIPARTPVFGLLNSYWRHVDWKVLLLAFVVCYLVPFQLVGIVTFAFSKSGGGLSGVPAVAVALAMFLIPPLSDGYFVARYSKQLPQFHVLLSVTTFVGFFLITNRTWSALGSLLLCFAWFGLAGLGAFLRLRRCK